MLDSSPGQPWISLVYNFLSLNLDCSSNPIIALGSSIPRPCLSGGQLVHLPSVMCVRTQVDNSTRISIVKIVTIYFIIKIKYSTCGGVLLQHPQSDFLNVIILTYKRWDYELWIKNTNRFSSINVIVHCDHALIRIYHFT